MTSQTPVFTYISLCEDIIFEMYKIKFLKALKLELILNIK